MPLYPLHYSAPHKPDDAAKADTAGTITEASENNTRLYTSSSFIGTDAATSQHILYVNGEDAADTLYVGTNLEGDLYVDFNSPYKQHYYDPAAVDEVYIYTHGGNDQVNVSSDFDKPVRIFGGGGNDTLYGGSAHDLIFGGLGDDALFGFAGDDQLDGGAGNDWLYGGDDDDALFGGPGNDTLDGEAGTNTLSQDGNASNVSPTADDETYEVAANSPLVAAAPGVLVGDIDANGDTLSAVLITGTAHGTVSLSQDGGFTYHPAAGFSGVDSFTYRASDGFSQGNLATVNLSVAPGPPDISITGITTDGRNISVDYSVVGGPIPNFQIALYASPDGITLGQLLQTVTGDSGPGPHSLSITPNFADWLYDYRLLAKLDSVGTVTEVNESNNALALASGIFLAVEPSGKQVLHIHGTNDADEISASRTDWTRYAASMNSQMEIYDPTLLNEVHIRAHGGNDRISISSDPTLVLSAWVFGGSGDDNLAGGAGVDQLFGGDGNDRIGGGAGSDGIYGEAGNDVLSGDNGNDGLSGGEGDDSLAGGNGNDSLLGDDGADNLYGGEGFDDLHGGDGADALSGGSDRDLLYGDEGDDALFGDAGDDGLYGDQGEDNLHGNAGNDSLSGGDDNDTLSGDEGDDALDGDAGNDSLYGGDGEGDASGDTDGNNSFDPDGDAPGNEIAPIEVVYCDINESAGEGGDAIIEICSFSEGPGTAQVTVTLTDGTAIHGSDYGGPTSITVTVDTGPNAGSVLIRVPALYDDVDHEPDETFSYQITNVVGGFTRDTEPMTMTIGDTTMLAVDDVYKTSQDESIVVAVEQNDFWPSKPIDETLFPPAVSSAGAAHGTVTPIPQPFESDWKWPTSFTYTPDPGFYGDDEFDYTITYENLDEYDVDASGDCSGCTETAHVFVNVRKIDLDNDADGDGSITEADEDIEPRPAPIALNVDDDNGNSIPDWEETGSVSGEDDLQPFNLTVALGSRGLELYDGWKAVLYMPDEPYGRVWTTADKSERLIGEYFSPNQGYGYGKVWTIGVDEIPETLYLEAGPYGFSGPGGTLGLALEFNSVQPFGASTKNLIQFGEFAIDLEVGGVGETLEDDPGVSVPYDPSSPATIEGTIEVGQALFGDPTGTLTWQIPEFLSVEWETSTGVWEEIQTGVPYSYEAGDTRAIRVTGEEEDKGNLLVEFAREGSTKSDQATISTHPIDLIENTIYGWEGDSLNAYIKAKSGQGQITSFEVDVNNDGAYDFALTEYLDEIQGAVDFGLPGLNLLPSQDDGEYPAKLRITNSLGTVSVFDADITIGNTPVLIEFGENDVLGQLGVPFTLNVTTSDPGPDTVSQIVIDWGDGTSDTISGSSGAPTHTYAAEGHYTIRATTTDEDESRWAEHEIDIGEDSPAPIDDGSPVILSAVATILGNGDAQLIVEAEDSSGSTSGLTFEWDLDNDGFFETPSGNSIEMSPGSGPDLYIVQVRITDSAGRWTEGRYQFTAGGSKIYAFSSEDGKKLFRLLTRALPASWHIHHTKQRFNGVLEARYLKAGIDINHPQYLRGVPEFVHDQITGDQNAWWAARAKEGKFPSNIDLSEVAAFEAKLDAKYSRYWVEFGASTTTINKAANAADADKFLLIKNKASRRVDLGITATTAGVFLLIANNTKVYANMPNFNPKTHAEFNIFIDKYEDCLRQALGPAGRPSEEAALQLVDTLIEFGRVMGLDADKLAKAKTVMYAGVHKVYH